MQKHNLVKGVSLVEDKLVDCATSQYGKQEDHSPKQHAEQYTSWPLVHKILENLREHHL